MCLDELCSTAPLWEKGSRNCCKGNRLTTFYESTVIPKRQWMQTYGTLSSYCASKSDYGNHAGKSQLLPHYLAMLQDYFPSHPSLSCFLFKSHLHVALTIGSLGHRYEMWNWHFPIIISQSAIILAKLLGFRKGLSECLSIGQSFFLSFVLLKLCKSVLYTCPLSFWFLFPLKIFLSF